MGDGKKSRASGRKRKRIPPSKRKKTASEIQDGGTYAVTNTSVSNLSASARKIGTGTCSSATSSDIDTPNHTKDGFILFSVQKLCDFIEKHTKCEDCSASVDCCLSLDSSTKHGFQRKLQVKCCDCPWNTFIDSSNTLKTGNTGKPTSEINLRMVQFVRGIGKGHNALINFSLYLNSPPPMTKKNYRNLVKRLHCANKNVCGESMGKAGKELKECLCSRRPTTTLATKRPRPSSPGPSTKHRRLSSDMNDYNCTVQMDGTWQRRGHASHHGVVTAISVDTGKCLDIEALTNICKGCKTWEAKDKSSDAYAKWKLNHKCKINHTGSAGAMEPVGAIRIFQRSEHLHGLKYTKYLGDGDSAAYNKVSEAKPYGLEHPIEKLECVGHVQKRCGTRLRRLKNENKHLKLSDKKGLGGMGRLTDKKIDTLQNCVGFAIRSHPNDLDGMKKSVSAVLNHVASTADNPMHDECPDGPDTWCKYKLDRDKYKHRNGLPLPVRDFIKPVFKDLAKEELLRKCLHGKTQNANECLNKLIWDRCSKEVYAESIVIEDAAYSAVSYFNDGCNSIINVMDKLGIKPGIFTINACNERDKTRIRNSEHKNTDAQKKRRKHIRAVRKGIMDSIKDKEGNVYEKGAH